MPYVHFKEKPLISSIRTETLDAKDTNIPRESVKSKQIEKEANNLVQYFFKSFRIFSALEFEQLTQFQ